MDCSENEGERSSTQHVTHICMTACMPLLLLQFATLLNLGWRILVLNEGDPIPPQSVGAPSVVASLLTVLLIAMITIFEY